MFSPKLNVAFSLYSSKILVNAILTNQAVIDRWKKRDVTSHVAHRAVTDSCNRSVSHTCETGPYQACYISVLQEICLELLCFTGFGKSLFHRSGTDLLSFCNT